MENNIVDELLNKIKLLDETNSNIKIKIEEVKIKMNSIENEKSDINLEDEMIIDDGNKTNITLNHNNNFDNNNLENLEEVTITYIPFEQHNRIWIMGDFTGWEPKDMNKNNDVFSYKIVLIKEFKYYFSFTAKNEVLIDFNQNFENNPRNNQVNNFLDVKSNIDSVSKNFDFIKEKKMLQDARKQFTKMRMGDMKEVKILEELIDFSNKYKIRSNYLIETRDETLNKIRSFYDNKIEIIKTSETHNFEKLCDNFKKRVFEKKGILYYLDSIILSENSIKCMRLYDDNEIKINLDYYIKKGFFFTFKFEELDHYFKIFSKEVSQNILAEHEKSNKILKVVFKYESGDSLQSEGLVYFKTYGKKVNILNLVPDLDISQYDFDTSGNMINDVKFKKDNLKIIYTIKEVKDEIENLPISLKIYYSYFKKTVNLIHIHSLNEKLKFNKGIEVFNLERNEDVNSYKIFNNENVIMKILFKNFRVNKIFYLEEKDKIVELRSEEFNLKIDRIVSIQHEGYLKDYSAKIKKIPVCLLANLKSNVEIPIQTEDYAIENEKVDACHFENICQDLTGYVDLQVIFDNDMKYLDYPINVSLPACMIQFLPISKEMELEKTFLVELNKRKSEEMTNLERIYNDVMNNYNNYSDNFSKEDLEKHLNILNDYLLELPKIGQYIEQKELWNYLEVKYIINLLK